MSDNPYSTPMASDFESQAELKPPSELNIASQGQRFANLLIDNIVIQVFSFGVGFIIGIVYIGMKVAQGEMNNGQLAPEDEATLNIVGFIAGILTALFYFIGMEALFQRTVGKFVTGTVVVDVEGRKPTLGRIVGRACARFIPFEALTFLGGNRPVGWHDSLSGTRVVKK